MKKAIRLISIILALTCILPLCVAAYPAYVVANPTVSMPLSSPVIDGTIEKDGTWSDAAYLNDATAGHFWATNPLQSTANLYFAYDANALYFAGEVSDPTFIASSGVDNVDGSSSSRPYGWNGDVMVLMLDALGVFERSSTQTTPWYDIGIYSNGSVHVYRANANAGDITSQVSAAGGLTLGGWRFEVRIPWSIISADVSSASGNKLSASAAALAEKGATTRAAAMYMDRYNNGSATTTWGRYITVCETTYDGSNGCHTSGTIAKAYGIKMTASGSEPHRWGDWVTVTSPTCTAEGLRRRTCADCGADEEESIPALGHIWSAWTVTTEPTETENGMSSRTCARCGEVETKVIAALGTDEPLLVAYYNASQALDYSDLAYVDVINFHPAGFEYTASPYIVDNYSSNVANTRAMAKNMGNEDIKIIFTVASNNLTAFETVIANATKRSGMVKVMVNRVKTYGYDGIDIDYEFPTVSGLSESAAAQKKADFVNFMTELRGGLDELSATTGKEYTLTMAVPGTSWAFSLFDMVSLCEQVDYFNIMNYDTYVNRGLTLHHTSPYDNAVLSGGSVASDIVTFQNLGVPASKIVPGCGLYSRLWSNVSAGPNGDGLYQAGTIDNNSYIHYSQLLSSYIGKDGTGVNTYTRYWDDSAKAPYLYSPTQKTFLSYDDAESVAYKCALVVESGVRGIMVFDYCTCDGTGIFKQIRDDLTSPVHKHSYTSKVTIAPSCTEAGVTTYTCSCGDSYTEEIPALGHSFGDWTTVREATYAESGLRTRTCFRCGQTEEEPIEWVAPAEPVLSVDNFIVSVENVEGLNYMRYLKGEYNSMAEMRGADGLIQCNRAYIVAHTDENGVLTAELPSTGVFTFWLRFDDGREFIKYVQTGVITPNVTTDGLNVNVLNLDGVKDVFLAYGTYTVFREVSNNRIVRLNEQMLEGIHRYTYKLRAPGDLTVVIRYNDNTQKFFYVTAFTETPTIAVNGLRATIGNIGGVTVIRTAPGVWSTSGEVKRAPGCRNFTQKNYIRGAETYTIQYAAEGTYTVAVQYENGYIDISTVDITMLKPTVTLTKSSITFSDIEGLHLIRFASGEYSTMADIKAARGARYRKYANAVDGKITVSGLEGRYTFCVQYVDRSESFYTYDFTFDPFEADNVTVNSERQLFFDDGIIDVSRTTASRTLHSPQKREQVFNFSAAWESGDTVYHNIVELPDGGYRMYYKATADARHICYIESADGINWSRPQLTVWKYGSTSTNSVTGSAINPDNLFVFYDTNPDCPEDKRWKGIYGQWGDGLFLEYSDDGKYFEFYPNEVKIMGTPENTGGCFFDSLNTVYWDGARGKYVAFVRGFHEGDNYSLTAEYVQNNPARITRDIRYAESDDCINWTTPVPLKYSDNADWQMYANAAMKYDRAGGVYIAVPTRYNVTATDGSSVSDAFTDNLFMASRDLVNWTRFGEQYMLPHTAAEKSLIYGDCYPCVGMIETSDGELSLYMKEKASGTDFYGRTLLYRYSIRTDGFVSMDSGTVTTRPLTFSGDTMLVNFKANNGGYVRVTLADSAGNTATSGEMTGDHIDIAAAFEPEVISAFEGKPCRVTFEVNNAELYSFKFE